MYPGVDLRTLISALVPGVYMCGVLEHFRSARIDPVAEFSLLEDRGKNDMLCDVSVGLGDVGLASMLRSVPLSLSSALSAFGHEVCVICVYDML